MPSVLQKSWFSASNFGRGVLVTATGNPGTLIHSATGAAATGTCDEIFLFLHNPTTGNLSGNVQWGGTGNPGDIITYVVPGQSMVEAVPGLVLASGLTVNVYGQVSSGLIAHGYVNRITN